MSAPITISSRNVQPASKISTPPSAAAKLQVPLGSPPSPTAPATPSRRRRTRRRLRASESCSQNFLDEYEFQEGEASIIGAGAYAVVRIATHRRTGEQYAVKVIDRSDKKNTREKCLNEARLLNQCNGFKNIVRLHDFKEDKDNYYMVFEYVQGGNLQSQLDARGGTLDETEVAAMIRDLANALHFLHSRRIAHRDLKPANILCENSDFVSPCKLADFDLASAESQQTTSSLNTSNLSSSMVHSPTSGQATSPPAVTTPSYYTGVVPLECRKSTTSNMDSGIDACSPSGMETSGSSPAQRPRSWSEAQNKMESVFEDEVLQLKRRNGEAKVEPPMEMNSPVGSPEYMPPEIATLFLFGNGYSEDDEEGYIDNAYVGYDAARTYTQACDVWSLGVIAYVAICGHAPFAAIKENCSNRDCKWNEGGACEQCQASLFEEIYYADLQFSHPKWKEISKEAKHLIIRCLDRNATTRISAYEILEHPFLQRSSSTAAAVPGMVHHQKQLSNTSTTSTVVGTTEQTALPLSLATNPDSVDPPSAKHYITDVMHHHHYHRGHNPVGNAHNIVGHGPLVRINNFQPDERHIVIQPTSSASGGQQHQEPASDADCSLLTEKFNSSCSLTETQLQELAHYENQIKTNNASHHHNHFLEDNDSGNCEENAMVIDEHVHDLQPFVHQQPFSSCAMFSQLPEQTTTRSGGAVHNPYSRFSLEFDE